MSSYGKIATRGALWGLVGRGANEIIALPTSMIIARLLTPADFGIAAAVGFFIQIANRLTNFGFNTALIQLKTVEPRHSSSVFVLSLVTGVLAWLALLVSAPSLGRLFGSPEAAAALPIAGLTFVIGGVASVPSALMIRELRYRETAILDGLATAVVAFSGLAFALLGFSYWSLVYSQILGALIPAIVRLRISGWSPAFEFSRSAIREMLSFGLGLHSKRLLDSAAQNLDNLLVGRALGIEALGFYDKAFSLMNRAVTLLSSGPAMSLRVLTLIEHDGPRFRTAYCKLVMVSAFLAYSILAVMCLVAPELIRIMFGSQWDAAALPFQILCVTGALKLLNSYASSGLQATGRAWGEVGRQIAYLILIVAGVWLGRPYGLGGVAAGVLVATLIMTVSMHELLCRLTHVGWMDLWRAQLPGVTCTAGLVCVLFVLRLAIAPGSDPFAALQFLLVAGLASVAYLALFVRLRLFAELDLALREAVQGVRPKWATILWGTAQPKAES